MKTLTIPFAAAIVAALAASPVIAQNAYSDRLAQYDELRQKSSLRRAILAEKQTCRAIVSGQRQQPYENLVMWTARCTNADFAIFIAGDGTVQVRPCADLKSLKLPECKLPPKK